jgi:hypothetical protein
MQRRGKHGSTTIELLLETVLRNPLLGSCNSWTTTMETGVFHMWSVPRSYLEDNWATSTVTLRVVGGNGKGSLKSETVKYGREYQGIRTRERLRWQGPAACTKDRPVISLERAPHKNKIITVK